MAVAKGAAAFYSRTANLPSITSWTVMGYVYITTDTDSALFYFGFTPGTGDRYGLEYLTAGKNLNLPNSAANFPGSTALSLNTWYHVAIVCSGSGAGQVKVYLDGNLEITADGNPTIVAGVLRLGGDSLGIEMIGRMAHWKVFHTALTQAEVQVEKACKFPRRNLTETFSYYRLDNIATDQTDSGPQGRTLTVNGTFTDIAGDPSFTGIQIERVAYKVTVNTGDCILTFGGTPAVGNHIIVSGECWESGGVPTAPNINDDAGNSYTAHIFPSDPTFVQGHALIASAPLAATFANLNVVVSDSGGGLDPTKTFSAMEVSGLLASPVDVSTSGTDSTSPMELSTGTLAQAEELVVSALIFIGSSDTNENIALTTWGGNNPQLLWTNNGPGIVGEFGASGYKIVASTSAVLVGYVADHNNSCAIAIVTFKGGTVDASPSVGKGQTSDRFNDPYNALLLSLEDEGKFDEIDVRNWW